MRPLLLATLLALALPSAAAASLTGFQSPSRNIGCYLDTTSGVRCDIRARTWATPPRPARCGEHTDYGQGLIVGRTGRGRVVCAGDTALGAGRVLGYGRRITSGRFTCLSERRGMTCRNTRSGHGFFLSRGSFRLF